MRHMTATAHLPDRAARLRVLYVQPSDLFGGEERQLVTVLPSLAAHGIDALPLVGPGRTIVEWLEARGVRDTVFSPSFPGNWQPARGIHRLGVLGRWRRSRNEVAAAIADLVRVHHIDLIYAAMPFAWAAATPVARRLGVPIVWRAGGPVYLGGRLLGSVLLAPWARLHPPDLLICSSAMVSGTFAGLVPAPRVAVINGVDTASLDTAPVPPSREGAVVVGFAGRLVARKGIEDLLDVAGRMAGTHPDVRFILAGDGNRRAQYEALARAAGADRNTHFAGFVADMGRFYAECDVIVLPSYSEGSSMVVLEAMAMGRAVLASAIPSLRELIEPDVHGVLVPPGDRNALAAALAGLCRDRERRHSLGDAARRRVYQHFTASAVAARIAELLHGVAARGRR
jgi:glycosyltransferase involved in cell wall biosynthesis